MIVAFPGHTHLLFVITVELVKNENKLSQSLNFVEIACLEILPAHSPKYWKIISRFPFVFTQKPM